MACSTAQPTTSDFATGLPNNQTLPPGILVPEPVPRDKIPFAPLVPTDRAKAEADGVALAQGHLAALRFPPDADVDEAESEVQGHQGGHLFSPARIQA